MAKNNEEYCSFCGRPAAKAGMLIAGVNGLICRQCAKAAFNIFEQEKEHNAALPDIDLKDTPKPEEIKAWLDRYVIGQDEAIQCWAGAV